ncbi:MAG: putative membrane protein required for colicin V production [Planctomycetota bacterium]|jgi:uncharacterized membrane protein required for colicin V production
MCLDLIPTLQESASAPGFQLSWVDWVGAGLGGIFALLGILRGLWWQVIRLLGILGSVALARTFSAPWGAALEQSSELSSEVATGVVWLGLFLIGIIITAVLGTIGKKSIEAIQLGLVDRAGGLIAGVATGMLLHVAWLVALAHLGPQPWTANKLEGTYSKGLLQAVTTRYPVLTQSETHASESLHQWLGAESKPQKKGRRNGSKNKGKQKKQAPQQSGEEQKNKVR